MPISLRFLLTLLLAFGGGTLHARQANTPAAKPVPTAGQTLDQLRIQLDGIEKALADKSTPNDQLSDLRSQALTVQDQAGQLVASLAAPTQSLQAQLDVLGAAPEKNAPAESPDVRNQRNQLNKQKADLDAQIKTAQLISQEAQQVVAQVADQRRNDFQARLAERTATPFSRAFWVGPMRALPDDLVRLRALGSDVRDAFRQAWQPPNRTPFLVCLTLAVLLLGVGRWLLERGLLHLTSNRMPPGHLRRSALAAAIALLVALNTGLAAECVYLSVNWNDLLDDDLAKLGTTIVRLILISAYISGLGRALLSTARPSWRMPDIADAEAMALRPFPWLLAVLTVLGGLVELVNHTVGASLPASVASRSVIALGGSGLIGAAILRLGRTRHRLQSSGENVPDRPLWAGALQIVILLTVALIWLSVAGGYIAFAFFAAGYTLYVVLVVCSMYVLLQLIGDGFELLLSPRGRNGQRLQQTFGIEPARLDLIRTVLVGLSRALVVLYAITIVTAAFGASPEDFLSSLGNMVGALKLGSMTVSPNDIVKAAMVVAIGLAVVRIFKRWLSEDLLPGTRLEPGMQSSIVTLLGYVGGILVFLLTLATLQVSLQNIAWIASALSVGIGFGLQAIVQNFISGLILLAERPVKVGDWISLAGVEGDVRRINVRATEIQMADRSTMIVPNSQLITQNVRNVTLANAQGRVSFKLPMPLDTDADKARGIILQALAAHAQTLDAPSPTVQLDSVDATSLVFSATAYTNSPREVSSVKSDLLFAVLEQLRAEKLPLTRPQDMTVRTIRVPRDSDGESSDSG
jgi:small-conductance mechanosensitive channel